MLKIPSFRQFDDVIVYQDDAVWNRFYLLPSRPSIRRDADGRPIFLLVLQHFSEQEREADPTLPRGAGYMNFDAQFSVEPSTTEAITRNLQAWVNEEHHRRGGAEPSPSVELAAPLLSGGKVTMHTTQSERLVTGRLGEVPASLVAGSTAVFNMDLTTEGANFMKGTLVDEDGAGRIDLTPIQVIYDMTMWARMPPMRITLSANFKRVHETLLKASETNQDNPCTPEEVETYRENGLRTATLAEQGLVDVRIDVGDAKISEETEEKLKDFAFELFDQMITERFLVPAEQDEQPLDFADAPPLHGADPGWVARLYAQTDYRGESLEICESLANFDIAFKDGIRSIRLRSGHTLTLYSGENHTGSTTVFRASSPRLAQRARSARIVRPATTRSRVRKTVNETETDLSLTLERSAVVEWPVGGQATLSTFFAGMSASDIARHVVEVREDLFQTLAVDVRAVVDFEHSPVAAVEVQVEYPAGAVSGGDPPTNTFTFDRNHIAPERFDPALVEHERSYRYRYRLIYVDGLETEPTPWQTTTLRDLNIAALDPGKIALDVSAASLNWSLLSAVVVELSYTHPDADVPPVRHTLELTELNPVGHWEHRLRKPLRGDAMAHFTYRLKDEKVVEGTPQSLLASSNLLVVRPPQVDVLDVGLVPAGDWSDVVQAVVMLHYDAGGGLVYDKSFRLTAIDQHVQWQVLLRDPERRTFTYQVIVTYANGNVDQQPEKTATGDQQIAIKVGEPKYVISVLSTLIDFTATPTVAVALDYHGQSKVLTFTKPGVEQWKLVRRPDGRRDYTYEVTWYTADGREIRSGRQPSNDEQLVLTRPVLPQPGKLEVIVRGFAVDYTVTPYVDVVLSPSEESREDSSLLTLSDAQRTATWSIAIGDRSHRKYRYAITYNLADGTRMPGPSGETTDPILSLTAYQPQ